MIASGLPADVAQFAKFRRRWVRRIVALLVLIVGIISAGWFLLLRPSVSPGPAVHAQRADVVLRAE
jgi:uncharacterized SAM-binding protein YcdF (DUF218 family)